MTREELAAMIYAHHYSGTYPSVAVGVANSLRQADGFFKELEKRREPKVCEEPKPHDKWHCGDIYCPQCNTLLAKPEPPKPERVAKEWNIYSFADGTYRAFSIGDSMIPFVGSRAPTFIHKVREVLP